MNNLTPGIYYQDILEDGTRSDLRQNFPTLKRVSYDKRPPVMQTIRITVENMIEEPLPLTKEVEVVPEIIAAQKEMGLHLNPDGYKHIYNNIINLNTKKNQKKLLEKPPNKIKNENVRL